MTLRPDRACTRNELTRLLGVLRAVDAGIAQATLLNPPDDLRGWHGWALYSVSHDGDWQIEVFVDGGEFDYVESWRTPEGDVLESPDYTPAIEEVMPIEERLWRSQYQERWGLVRDPTKSLFEARKIDRKESPYGDIWGKAIRQIMGAARSPTWSVNTRSRKSP